MHHAYRLVEKKQLKVVVVVVVNTTVAETVAATIAPCYDHPVQKSNECRTHEWVTFYTASTNICNTNTTTARQQLRLQLDHPGG